MNKKIRHLILALVGAVIIILAFIAMSNVEKYKNVQKAEYARKVNNIIIDALSDINKYLLKEHTQDSLKYQCRLKSKSNKDKHLQYYPINSNGKWKIIRQIIAGRTPESYLQIKGEKVFVYDDGIHSSVTEKNILEEVVPDARLYALFDTIHSHAGIQPMYKDYELDTIYNIIEKHLRMNNIHSDFDYCIYVPAFNEFVLCNGLDATEIATNGMLYNFEVYNEDLVLFAFFIIQFLDKTDYLTAHDYFVIIFIWTIVFIFCFLFFVSLHFIDRRILKTSVLRDDFINNITHEFRTPISTIALATESLLDKDVWDNKDMSKKYIEIIQEENKRLKGLAETFLETTSIVSRKSFLRRKKNNIDLHYCIEPAIKEILLLLHKKKGTITIEYLAKNSIACVDGTQIVLVIKNILDNAIKYSLNDPPRIEIKTVNNGKYILISIQDNGIGISKKQQNKIFNKLYRSSIENINNVKGYGLGLYNAKAIIKSYKGKIKVKSELNKGSTFTIYLPVVNK